MSLALIDIGINLAHASFNRDRQEVIERAKLSGVDRLIITGTSVRGSREALRLASEYPEKLFSTAGVHPHDARHFEQQTIRHLRDMAKSAAVVAIGECGLDFNRDFSPRDVQERCFAAQIELACEMKLPLFLHERDAHQKFIEILKRYRNDFDNAVVHCFTGTGAEMDAYLAMDLYVGITGWICDERRGTHLRELVRRIPLNRLMIETDAPFLTPRDMRPKPSDGRNEPAFLPHILNTIAKCMGKSREEVATATTENAINFFRIKQ